MRSYYLILILLVATKAWIVRNHCDACLENKCYSKAPILDDDEKLSGQLAVDRKENIVHFHYTNRAKDFTVSFDLDDVRFKIIPNIDFSFARTVDQSSGIVYVSGALGIFEYNALKNSTTRFGLFDKTIWHMQFKGRLYYTIYLTKGLFVFDNNKSKSVPALSDFVIDDFIIDRKDDIYFMSDFQLYRLRKGAKSADLFANDSYVLSTDKYDNVYFTQTGSRGIFTLDYRRDLLSEVGALASGYPTSVVFDNKNNIIYVDADDDMLYYLVPNYGRCTVTSRGWGRSLRKMVSVS